jgi:flagellar basal body-associated protein FliL
MMRILGLIVVTVVCAVVAAGICAVFFGMIPWMRSTWCQIRTEEKKREEDAKKTSAVVITLYTYNRERQLVRLGEKKAARQ